ncbi:hypothetical protein AB0D08_06670 [Kitasatospora sp. NPDC048540]|uniref:hypothetical protein n=1 Tax=Kitasatospora sp. NPDC048540 TaxID=3155634 RepID=UPI0033C511A4
MREVQARPGHTSLLRWPIAVDPGMQHLPTEPQPDPAMLEFVGAHRVPAGGWVETSGDGGELYLAFRAESESCKGCDSHREHDVYLVTVAP